MTNAEAVFNALKTLEATSARKILNATDVMWQVRRDGWQMTSDKARNVLKVLVRTGRVECVMDGKRYFFRTVQR